MFNTKVIHFYVFFITVTIILIARLILYKININTDMIVEPEVTFRNRRAQSVNRAEEITETETKNRYLQFDKPLHKPRDSIFSWSSGFQDYTGLVTWGFFMLLYGSFRLCLENLLKFGLRVKPIEWILFFTGTDPTISHPSVILLLFSTVPAMTGLLLEKFLASNKISESCGLLLHVSNILILISLPVIVYNLTSPEFSYAGIQTLVCIVYLILSLKLWSYCHTNYWCREAEKRRRFDKLRRQRLSLPNYKREVNNGKNGPSSAAGIVEYPDNLNLKDLVYFLLAPTLCYELNFPRTARIRKRFLIKRILELIFGVNIVLALFQQWIVPTLTSVNGVELFSEMDLFKITESLLSVAMPNHLLWLCLFYLLFHSFLNLTGELLQFADRYFYKDWWNANNVGEFWSSWNMPVHKWAVRHVYVPLMVIGYSKAVATFVVYFISALFHEYLVSVPLQMYRIWAFSGMMLQIPMAIGSRYVHRRFSPRWGNVMVWHSLIIGIPLVAMMYYHDYVFQHLKSKPSAI